MKDLIEALTILLKYGNPERPTNCSHDELAIMEIDPAAVSTEDKARLGELGFFISTEYGDEQFISYRFGSA